MLLILSLFNYTYSCSVKKLTLNNYTIEELKDVNNKGLIIYMPSEQFSHVTGIKMSIWDKISFKILKIKMKHDSKKLESQNKTSKKRISLIWILVGCALVIGLGILAVLSDMKI